VGSRAPILVESKPNAPLARWTFVHDQLACGRRPLILNIVGRDAGVPGGDPRPLDLRPARGAGTDGVDQTARQAQHDRLGTMGPSSPRTPGRRTTGSSGISLRQESRCRVASARVSTATRACSSPRSCRTKITNWADDYRQRRQHSALSISHGGLCRQYLYYTRSSARPDQLRRSHVVPRTPSGVKLMAAEQTRCASDRLWNALQETESQAIQLTQFLRGSDLRSCGENLQAIYNT
jgi:hypothetical protein